MKLETALVCVILGLGFVNIAKGISVEEDLSMTLSQKNTLDKVNFRAVKIIKAQMFVALLEHKFEIFTWCFCDSLGSELPHCWKKDGKRPIFTWSVGSEVRFYIIIMVLT